MSFATVRKSGRRVGISYKDQTRGLFEVTPSVSLKRTLVTVMTLRRTVTFVAGLFDLARSDPFAILQLIPPVIA